MKTNLKYVAKQLGIVLLLVVIGIMIFEKIHGLFFHLVLGQRLLES